MQENRGRDRGYDQGPKKNPTPPDGHRNGVIEHVAMPPFSLAGRHAGICAPTLETRGTNVLCSQLQIAQCAHEAAAPPTAGLKHLVRMKEACRLVCKRGGGICDLPDCAPDADL